MQRISAAFEHLGKRFHKSPNLVAHPAVVPQNFFLAGGLARQPGGIVEAAVDHPGPAGKERAIFAGVIADRHHEIKGHVQHFVDVCAVLLRNIDAGFGHDLYGDRVEAMYFDAGGVGFDVVSLEMAGKSLCHLAATGITGAKEQDPLHVDLPKKGPPAAGSSSAHPVYNPIPVNEIRIINNIK